MLNPQLVNALFKSFSYKCDDLNYILENTSNIKELSVSFELIVNSIFGLETGLNLTQNEKYLLQWPLKLVDKYNNPMESNSIFSFLSAESLFWSIIFKLSNLQINFKYSINLLPNYIRYRIENSLSILTARLDTMNYLNLNALEYYLVCFISNLLSNDGANKTRFNYSYNEFNGKMDLNCVYSDLLENYLNFFLPINSRDVNFPQLINYTQNNTPSTTSLLSSPTSFPYYQHPIQAPRLLKTSYFDDNEQYQNEYLKQENTTQSVLEQINLNLFQKKLDRTNDLQKIDFFLKLFIDFWICPFSDGLNEKFLNTQLLVPIEIIFEIKLIIKHVYSFSNANYNINSTRLLDVSTTATTGRDASRVDDDGGLNLNRIRGVNKVKFDNNNNNDDLDGSYINNIRKRSHHNFQTPIDDLRIKIVNNYLKKPIYRFLKYNIENWSLSPTIKFLMETWLLFIQPWCPQQAQEGMHYDQFMFDIHPSESIWSEFIRDNLFIYVDLYQLILRRFGLLDLTLLSNVQLLYRICCIFSHRYLVQTIEEIENNIFYIQRTRLSLTTRIGGGGGSSLLKPNLEKQQQQRYTIILDLFKEFNKQIFSYKSLFGSDSRKIAGKLMESLINTKNLFIIDNQKKLVKKNEGFLVKIFKAMFYDGSDQNYRLAHLNAEEIDTLKQLIDECVGFLDRFYQAKPDEPSFSGSLSDSLSKSIPSSAQTSFTENITPDYEPSNDGLTLRLSPRGRDQMLNAVCKTNIEKIYDPDTAPISEFESKPLVYFLRFLTDFVNYKFQNKFQEFYNRPGIIGAITKKILYGPLDYKNKVLLKQQRPENGIQRNHVRLSLRKLADYRFIFYFFIIFFLIKIIFGFSYLSNFFILFLMFSCYILIRAIFGF